MTFETSERSAVAMIVIPWGGGKTSERGNPSDRCPCHSEIFSALVEFSGGGGRVCWPWGALAGDLAREGAGDVGRALARSGGLGAAGDRSTKRRTIARFFAPIIFPAVIA